MLRNLTIVVGLTIGSLSLANQSAHALSWNWSVGGNHTGSGTFITTAGPEPYIITGITGTFDGSTITGLISYYNSDNNLFSSVPQLNNRGVGFSNGTSWKLFYYSGTYYALDSSSTPITFSATKAVPFEFSPEQGFILGIPLFLGLRKLKKKRA